MVKRLNKGRPKNKRDLIRFSSHIPKDQYHLLKCIGEEEDLSIAQIVRRAIELYLVSQKEVLSIDESELAMANHISETRSLKAMRLNQLTQDRDEENPIDLFKDLNPEAF